MELKDIKMGMDHTYYHSETQEKCYVVNCHVDDGAALIIETYKDDDLTCNYMLTEACFLTPFLEYVKNGVFEALNNSKENEFTMEDMTSEQVAKDLIKHCIDLENCSIEELIPHINEWVEVTVNA